MQETAKSWRITFSYEWMDLKSQLKHQKDVDEVANEHFLDSQNYMDSLDLNRI